MTSRCVYMLSKINCVILDDLKIANDIMLKDDALVWLDNGTILESALTLRQDIIAAFLKPR